MIKLKSILPEIKLAGNNNKKQVLSTLAENHPYLLERLSDDLDKFGNIQNFLNNSGFQNMEQFLDGEYGYEEDGIKEITNLCNLFFALFKPKEIWCSVIGDGSHGRFDIQQYKTMKIEGAEDGEFLILLHNL